MHRFVLGVLVALWMAYASVAVAEDVHYDTALVLAVDVSDSVDDYRYDMQRSGYADAFRHPQVLNAIGQGYHGAILVTMMHWSGASQQAQMVGWRAIHDKASAEKFGQEVAISQRAFRYRTSISGAIDFSAGLLKKFPSDGSVRRIIDVSGDGPNNDGRSVVAARNDAVEKGITINGLPIRGAFVYEGTQDVVLHYQTQVIGGPRAFVVEAASYNHFANAIRQKLVLEISMR